MSEHLTATEHRLLVSPPILLLAHKRLLANGYVTRDELLYEARRLLALLNWLRPADFTPERLTFQAGERMRCVLCEGFVRHAEREAHVRVHCREFEWWQRARRAEARREATKRLRGVNRERKLANRA